MKIGRKIIVLIDGAEKVRKSCIDFVDRIATIKRNVREQRLYGLKAYFGS